MAIPPFPADVDTLDLPVLDHARLRAHDEGERDRLFAACIDLGGWPVVETVASSDRIELIVVPPLCTVLYIGFFQLANAPIDPESMFALARAVFRQPDEEKKRFDMGTTGHYYGWRGIGDAVRAG